MHWNIAAPFFRGSGGTWLDNFIEDPGLTFHKVPAVVSEKSWHQRKSNVTPATGWLSHWRHSARAFQGSADGIITVFPQLAATAGLQSRLRRDDRPIIAWCFNLGRCYPGLKQRLSRAALARIDRFVVHSTAEIDSYSSWLGLDRDRFVFVPLQRGRVTRTADEDMDSPFILSVGSARRDYRTFFDAAARLGYPTTVIAKPSAIAGLTPPANVTVLSGLSPQQCSEYVQRARLCVIPVGNDATASGQVTLIEAMAYGKPVVATACIGTVDYVDNGRDGILVPPKDAERLAFQVKRLWEQETLRATIANNARTTAATRYSDTAAAAALAAIAIEVSGGGSKAPGHHPAAST